MSFKISLAGDLGSGKSTITELIIAATGARRYSTGVIAREVAARHGMDIAAFNVYMESHPELDEEIDRGLMALSDLDEDLIIDSRMAWHFVRNTFKVYLSVDLEVSAARIMGAGRSTEHFDTLEETKEQIRKRRASERKRYRDLYGVDCKDLTQYNLVLDTTYASPEAVAQAVLDGLAQWQRGAYHACLLNPRRLLYPDDAADMGLAVRMSSALECGEDLTLPVVFEEEGNFYISDGVEQVIAYSLIGAEFVPCRLTAGTCAGRKYVRMENTL